MPARWARLALTAAALAASAVGAYLASRVFLERSVLAELAEARRERSDRRPGAAVQRLNRLDTSQPGRADVLYELGLAEAARGRVSEAVVALARIPYGTPESSKSLVLRSRLEILRGRLSVVEDFLTEALRRPASDRTDPDRPAVRDALVRLLRSEGRFAEARNVFLAGFREAVDPLDALRSLYRMETTPFPVEGVRTYLDNASKNSPEDDRVWLGRAYLDTKLGKLDEAGRLLDACLERRPHDRAVWSARLEWACSAERPEMVRAALSHLPGDPVLAEEIRAWFAARRGDSESERRALERRLALDPGRSEVMSRLAVLEQNAGRFDSAARLRARQDKVSRARERYHDLLAASDARAHATELAGLAELLGMTFEFAQWRAIAGLPTPAEHRRITNTTLADLLFDVPLGTGVATAKDRVPAAKAVGPRLADDAESAGLRFVQDNGAPTDPRRMTPPVAMSGGVALLDYDGDGWLDVYCVQGGPFPPAVPRPGPKHPFGDRLYRNGGDGTFQDVTESSGLAAFEGGYGHGVAVGDYDNDGAPDLFVTRWRSYALYRNKGDGTFEETTHASGLSGDRDWPTSAAFADLDADGDLDLYVCHYLEWNESGSRDCTDPKDPAKFHCNPLAFPAKPDHVFRNDGGRFTDVTTEAGLSEQTGRGLGVIAADLDGDNRVDLFVANDMSANFLFKNLGGYRFEEVAVASGVAANASGGYQAGMGVASGDLDGDGRPDLLVTNFYNESTTLFRNLGRGAFADDTVRSGLAASSRFLLGFGLAVPDLDNDGRLDLISANGHIHDARPLYPYAMPVQICLGDGRGRMTDVTALAGPAVRSKHLGRGLATGDLDNDGRIDALVVAQNEPLVYLHNQSKTDRHFVVFRLRGRESNRDGVGAVVILDAGGRRQVAQRIGGGSYQSAGDPRLHFGLGSSSTIDSVEVHWPSGKQDRHARPAADTGHWLSEGARDLLPLQGYPKARPRNGSESDERKAGL